MRLFDIFRNKQKIVSRRKKMAEDGARKTKPEQEEAAEGEGHDARPKKEAAEDAAPNIQSALEEAAEGGDPEAQFELGRRLFYGNGVEKDRYAAAYWFHEAAQRGHADAQFHLAEFCFFPGEGVWRDRPMGMYWLQKAAEQGHGDAQYSLGAHYLRGDGTERDYEKAVFWLEKAEAQAAVHAVQFWNESTLLAARSWLQYQRDPEAMDAAQLNCIAGCYESGHLVRRNLPRAFELYQKGAQMGDAEAEYNLAECYYNGSGTQKDPVQAVFWFKMAERHGYAAAGELSALYEKDLTPDQLASVLQELDLKSAPTAFDKRTEK